jgi:pimeloyl-ACP methyl ester carboxylesterase
MTTVAPALPTPELLAIPMHKGGRVDIYSGVARRSGCIWAGLHRPAGPTRTVLVVTHPSSNFLGHYILPEIARLGFAAVGLNTRYIANDSALIVENCVLDVAAGIAHLRDMGFENVVLVGNSGGGGLAALYQAEAESARITSTPAGDPPDLTAYDLPRADALVTLMAHPGRASVYTEWLDPAIVDENDPFRRDPELDLFADHNTPPYSADFVALYRAAQRERNHRITAWVRERLAEIDKLSHGRVEDLPFVVHGTCADPRFLDLGLDPSDRDAGTLWGDPYSANLMPATLGHLTSLRSWLSQWSLLDSNADGPRHLARLRAPVMVVYGTGDTSSFPSHARALYDAVGHDDKELAAIEGANHYYLGQPDLLHEAAVRIVEWIRRHGIN